jgi:carbonic anhydrase/acetyltransferase-like protein (isoleucine patch superfamily)
MSKSVFNKQAHPAPNKPHSAEKRRYKMKKEHYKIREDLSIKFKGRTLYRIEALEDLPKHNVKSGDIGGFVESYNNLSDDAWVGGDAKVFYNARVYENARVVGDAQVFGNAQVSGNALVLGDAKVHGNAELYAGAQVYGDAEVFENAHVVGHACVFDDAQVFGDAWVCDNARVFEDARVYADARVCGNAEVSCEDIEKLGDVKNITGEKYNITILPQHIRIGCQLCTKEEWFNFDDREIFNIVVNEEVFDFEERGLIKREGEEWLKWWKKWKPALMTISEMGE